MPLTNLQHCIALVKQLTHALAEGKPTAALWKEFHRWEAKLSEVEVRKLNRYVNLRA